MYKPLPAKNLQVLVVSTDPKPNEVSAILDSHRSVGSAHPSRPVAPNIPEPQRRMSGIDLQKVKVTSGRLLHRRGQLLEASPEMWSRSVHLKDLKVP